MKYQLTNSAHEPDHARWPAPFPGLLAFRESDSELFFGRREATQELLRRLSQNRFLVVAGSDGAGKSSLLQAGLLVALDSGQLPHSGRQWWKVIFRVDESPVRELADAIWRASRAARGGEDADPAARAAELRFLEATLRSSDLGVLRALLDQGLPSDTDVIVWLERADDLIRRRSHSTNELADFQTVVDLLIAAARQTQRRIHVVLTMRADTLDGCERFVGLPEAVNAGLFILPRMRRDQLQEAIEGPLQRFAASWEVDLVPKILDESDGLDDALPRLQHAMLRAWHRASDRGPASRIRLTLDDYRAVGGIGRSIAVHVEEIVNDVARRAPDESSRSRVFAIGRQLPTLLENDRNHDVTIERIATASGAPWHEVATLVARLASPDCNFLALDAIDLDSLLPETRVGATHDSIWRYWPALAEAPAPTERAARRERPRTAETSSTSRWRPLIAVWLLAVVATASIGGVQWFMEEFRARRTAATQPLAGGSALAGSTPAGSTPETLDAGSPQSSTSDENAASGDSSHSASKPVSGIEGATTRDQLERNRRVNRAERAIGLAAAQRGQDPVLSLLLASEAARSLRSSDPWPSAFDQTWRDAIANCSGRALAGHEHPVRNLALSADERWAATVSDVVRLWDLREPEFSKAARILPLPQLPLREGASDGKADEEKADNGKAAGVALAARMPEVAALRFLRLAPYLEAVLDNGDVWRWPLDAPSTAPETESHAGLVAPVRRVAFRPGTDDFATCAEDGSVTLWTRPTTDRAPGPLARRTVSSGGNRDVSFSSNGRWLITAGGVVQVWSIDSGATALRGTLWAPEHQEFARVVASSTARWIAAADSLNNVFLWDWRQDSASGSQVIVAPSPIRAEGLGGSVTDLEFDPQETWLALGTDDRTIQIWPLNSPRGRDEGGEEVARSTSVGAWVLPHDAPVRGLTISGDGRWLASTADDGALRLWAMPPTAPVANPVALWQGVAGYRDGLVASESSSLIGVIDGDGQARTWDLLTATDIQGQFLLPAGYRASSPWAWSARGDRVAVIVRETIAESPSTSVVVWRTNDERGWIPEGACEIPLELRDTSLRLLWNESGETLLAVSDVALGEPASIVGWRFPPPRDSLEVATPFLPSSPRQPPAIELREAYVDLQFGPAGMLLVTPAGRVRAWKYVEIDDRYVEASIPPHTPARQVRMSVLARRMAIAHAPNPTTTGKDDSYVVSLWGPTMDDGDWLQIGFWDLPRSPTANPTARTLAMHDRWLIARCGNDARDSDVLRGWQLDMTPPQGWTLPAADIEDYRISADGTRLLVESSAELRIYVLDAPPRLTHSIRHGDAPRSATTWSSDGRWLARPHASSSIELWDLEADETGRRTLLRATSPEARLLFARHGRWLVALHPSGYLSRWPTSWDMLVTTARRAAGRNLTAAEWAAAFPEQRQAYEETFAGLGQGEAVTAPLVSQPATGRTGVAPAPVEDGTIRYWIESVPTLPDGDDARAAIRAAWQAWDDTQIIASREVDGSGHPHVVIRAEQLDGPDGLLARGQLGPPQEGLRLELRLDSESSWTLPRLRQVAARELGHILGLTTSSTAGQLMSDVVNEAVVTPQPEDLERLKQLWEQPR